MNKKTIIIIIFSVLSVMVAHISKAAVITVATTHDKVPGSLRAAITEANTNGEDNTIYLPAGIYILSGAADDDANVGGDLDIDTDRKLTITGQGKNKSYIDGNGIDRVLHILNGTVSITDLTIRNGKAPDNLGKGGGYGGAGIYNCGNLILTRCVIKENRAGMGGDGDCEFDSYDGGYGGGIYNQRMLTLNKCIIMDNRAGNGGDNYLCNNRAGDGGGGGGILNSGVSIINNCIITSNDAGNGGDSNFLGQGSDGGGGGGIYNTNILTINNCTISNNKGGENGTTEWSSMGGGGNGGGIYNNGNLTMSGCTINDNTTGMSFEGSSGGGIYNIKNLMLIACTISGNYALYGGGLYNSANSQLIGATVAYNEGIGIFNVFEGIISLKNSIVTNNIRAPWGIYGPDCYGTFDLVSYSLIADTTDCILTGFQKANILGQDPLLGPLADNGGPTKTHALLPGSPAIDAGNRSGLYTDQRGYKRPINIPGIPNVSDGADIGAYEFIAPYSTAGATSYSGSEPTQETVKQ
ncbi:MAG: hypothetical protein NT166_23740 [Candidatus Aminicenantes bacterium]|nr:hypothetical protein [Candidatus Aminicenantes bacterium]